MKAHVSQRIVLAVLACLAIYVALSAPIVAGYVVGKNEGSQVFIYEDPNLPVVCWYTERAMSCLPKWALVDVAK